MLAGVMKERFKFDMELLIPQKPLFYGSFVPMIYPEGDD
jgi:hypothetical protein